MIATAQDNGTETHVTRTVLDLKDQVTDVFDARHLSEATWTFTYDHAGRPISTRHTQALGVRQKIHPPDHWRIDEARGMVGVARLRAGRLTEAETDLLAAYEGLKAHRGPTAEETDAARTRLVELCERWNRPADARRYRSDAR